MFGMTKTEHELSLVMEKDQIGVLRSFAAENGIEGIEVWPQDWIALRTDLGSSSADSNETVVNSLAQPLARAKISIFYMSTYSSDYCLVGHFASSRHRTNTI